MTFGSWKPKHVCVHSVRSDVGKHVNLRLRDGVVIPNVFLVSVVESKLHGELAVNRWVLKVRTTGGRLRSVPLRYVVLVDPVSPLVQLLQEVS